MIKNFMFILLCILLFNGCALKNIALDQQDDEVNVILLAGQSNMEGMGNYDALDESSQRRIERVSERVLLSNKGGDAIPLSYTLSSWKKKRYGFEKGFGPEIFIGLTMAEKYPNKKFLLIKTAYGGTSLYGAWNTHWTSEKAKKSEDGYKKNLPLYKMFKENVKGQLAILDEQKKPYKIIGMAWMQGENDAGLKYAALKYGDNLKEFIKQNRLNANLPNLPFVIGQINSTYGRFKKGPRVVRQAMVDIAKADNYTEIVLTDTDTDSAWSDFPKHDDNTHYNTEGQKQLGKAFAAELLKLID